MSKGMSQWQAQQGRYLESFGGVRAFSAVNFPATRAVPLEAIWSNRLILASQTMAQSG